jgi:uncharacterized protein
MDSEMAVQATARMVIWGAFALGLVFGAAGQWSRFCVRGAIADWVESRQPARLASWLIAIVVAAVGSQVLIAAGLFDATRTLAWSERMVWASYLIGGTLFGYGMILARGCPQRSLVKTGSGDLRAVITLLVTGVAAQMTLRGVFAEARTQGLDSTAVPLGHPQDLGSIVGSWIGIEAATLRWLFLALLVAAVSAWVWRHRASLKTPHWIGAVVIGLLVPAAWYLTGHIGFIAEHPDTLEAAWLATATNRPEALSFTAPLANGLDLLSLWTDKSNVATFGVMVAAGVLLGSFASALIRRDFKLETFESPQELLNHLIGGTLMGFGGITALGCSIGQGLTGLAMLSGGAVLAAGGIVFGAWAALRVQGVGTARRRGRGRLDVAAA